MLLEADGGCRVAGAFRKRTWNEQQVRPAGAGEGGGGQRRALKHLRSFCCRSAGGRCGQRLRAQNVPEPNKAVAILPAPSRLPWRSLGFWDGMGPPASAQQGGWERVRLICTYYTLSVCLPDGRPALRFSLGFNLWVFRPLGPPQNQFHSRHRAVRRPQGLLRAGPHLERSDPGQRWPQTWGTARPQQSPKERGVPRPT